MKVVIAAAGQGTRMLHLSRNKSKHLIKVQEKPFLGYLLDNLKKSGYNDFILVVGYRAELVEDFLKEYNLEAKLVNQFEILGKKEEQYGTLCPLKCVKDLIGEEDFLMVPGDNLFSVKDLSACNIEDEYNYVVGFEHKSPEKYGVLVSDNGFLKEIIEKPEEDFGNLINTGLYKFTPEVFEKIPEVKKSPRGEYEITDAITLLAQEKKVKIKKIQDYWLDFGNPGDIMKLSKFFKKNHD